MTDTAQKQPTMLGEGILLGRAIKGYHYASSPDGALCFEIDEPALGLVTITAQGSDFAKSGAVVVTRDLFEAAMRSYLVEFSAKKK